MLFANSGSSFLLGLIASGVAAYFAYTIAQRQGRNAVLWAAGCFLAPFAIIALFLLQRTSPEKSGPQDDWAESKAHLPYVHSYKGYGIAVDPEAQMLHLRTIHMGRPVARQYAFSDVRGWKYNISSGGHIQTFGNVGVNTALGVGAANIMNARKNEAETGLFIEARDIDMPEWRIAFKPTKERSHEFNRWIEILRQYLNEGAEAPAR
ncbi:MAG: DUF4755 domain-containing protein [Sphingobium sp.]